MCSGSPSRGSLWGCGCVPRVLLLLLSDQALCEQGKLLALLLPQFPCLSFLIPWGCGSRTGVTSGCVLRSVKSSCGGGIININNQAGSGLRCWGGTGGGREAALSHRAGAALR